MTNLLVDDRDQLFVLHEMLNMKSLFDNGIFSEFSEKGGCEGTRLLL